MTSNNRYSLAPGSTGQSVDRTILVLNFMVESYPEFLTSVFSQQPLAPQAWKDAEQEALLPSAHGYPPLPGHHFAPVCPCLFFSPKDYSRIRLENPFLLCMSSLSNYFP